MREDRTHALANVAEVAEIAGHNLYTSGIQL